MSDDDLKARFIPIYDRVGTFRLEPIEDIDFGGGGGPSVVQADLGGVDGVITQGVGPVILASSLLTVIYANFVTADPLLAAGFLATIAFNIAFADGTAGEAGEKIFLDIAAAFNQIPVLAGRFALLHGANWQGGITEREGTSGLIATGLPHTFQDWFADSLGQPVTDPLTGGDFILLVTSTFGGPTP